MSIPEKKSILDPKPTAEAFFEENLPVAAFQKTLEMEQVAMGGDLADLFWESRGPNDVGGRVRSILFDPNDAANDFKKVWAGSVSGGLWYNNDITSSNSLWQPINDLMANLSVMTITYDPNNTNTFYLGTGEGIGNTQHVRGAGIFKSTDGGSSWQSIGSTANDTRFGYVHKVVVTAGGTVLAATKAVSGSNGGIFRSTNGGTTWTQVLTGYGADLCISKDGDIYAALGIFNTTITIRKSTNDGLTWSNITPSGIGSGRAVLACSKLSNGTLYISSGQGGGSVRKTIDGGINWSLVPSPKYFEDNCTSQFNNYAEFIAFYAMMINVSPTNDDLVLLGGFEPFRSTDGGTSWSQIAHWLGECQQFMHADHHTAVFRPNHPNEVVFGNDGGVFYSPDMGNSSVSSPTIERRNNGLIVAQFYDVELDPRANKTFMLAGAQDNAVQKFNKTGMNPHQQIWSPDGFISHIDKNNPNFHLYGYNSSYYRRSFDGGATHERLDLGGLATANFFNPIAYDSDTKTAFIASSNDKMYAVKNIDTTPINTLHTFSLFNRKISTIKVSPHTNDRVFIGTEGGRIFRVDNASTSAPIVTNVSGNIAILGLSVMSDIEIGATDNDLLVACKTYGRVSVWSTTNGGSTWTDREGNLPDMPVRTIIYHPFDQTKALIGTETGIWTTDDLLSASPTWYPINMNGMANVRTDDIEFRSADSLLAIATYGRGVFTTPYFRLGNSTLPEVTFLGLDPEDINESATTPERGFEPQPGSFYEYEFPVFITKAPNATTLVDVTISGDVYDNSDYVLLTPQLTFPAGEIATQFAKIRIPDDAHLENTESLIMTLSLANSGSTNAIIGKDPECSFDILDNDTSPGFESSVVIYEEEWEGVSATGYNFWDATNGTYNSWIPTAACLNPTSAIIVFNGASCNYAGNGSGTDMMIFNDITNSDYTGLELSFDWVFAGNSEDYGQAVISLDQGVTWDPIGPKLFGTTTIQRQTIPLPASANYNDFWFGIQFIENGDATVNTSNTLEIDNILISGVQSAIPANNLSTTATEYLGPNDVVIFKDENDRPLVKVENMSSHDYGNTTVTIDRSGYSGAEFWNNGHENSLTSKSFMITPTNNNPTGSYFITLYLSEQEVTGWLNFANNNLTSTTRTFNDLTIAKTGGAISSINPLSPNANGQTNHTGTSGTATDLNSNYHIRAFFDTGFSGFGAGSPGPPPSAPLPVQLVSFEGRALREVNLLEWSTAEEINHDYFSLEKSDDGTEFSSMARIKRADREADGIKNYSFEDEAASAVAFYRLKQVDLDRKFEYSNTIRVENNLVAQLKIYPNPVKDQLNIFSSSDCLERVTISNLNGQIVLSQQIQSSKITMAVGHLSSGIYLAKVEGCGSSKLTKIYKTN